MSGPDTSVHIGVYRGEHPDITAIQKYEAFLHMPAGTTVNYVLAFADDTPASWAQFEHAMLPDKSTPATAWAPLLGPRKLVLAVPACAMGTTWADEASGVNNAHWTALAKNLAGGGLGSCVLRIAREFNGGWYRWKATPANVSSYATGYAHIVTVMRAAGFAGKFMWNPYLGPGPFGAAGTESAYPGNAATDIIGLDLYDGPDSNYPAGETIRTLAQQQAVWGRYLGGADGLIAWRNFASAHSKPLAYPEWGLRLWNDASYGGGGDNAIYIREMAGWLKDTRPFMHAFWEDPGVGVSDPDSAPNRLIAAPAARAAFLAEFGYG